MIQNLVTDDDILSKPCEDVTPEDEQVAQDLIDTLSATDKAACLSANQIGVNKRMFAFVDKSNKMHVMCNVSIKQTMKPFTAVEECMSREGTVEVKRFSWIKVNYEEIRNGQMVKKKGTYEGWLAQVIQHMVDHCKGKLV